MHKWTMPVSGVLFAAGLALLTSQVMASRLEKPPTLPMIDIARPVPALPAPVKIEPGGFVPVRKEPSPTAIPAPSTGMAKSGLPIDLIGTMVTAHGAKKAASSLAILQMTTGSKDISVVRVGQKWQGLELLRVERGRVWVRNLSSGAEEYISNEQLTVSGVDLASRGKPAASDGPGSGAITLSRAQVNRAIENNTNVIFSWVDVQPFAVGGAVAGFKLNNIKPRGKPFFNLLGFREGDVIKRVNGVKMDSVDKAVGLWGDIHGKEQVTFTIERDGTDKELTLVFKP